MNRDAETLTRKVAGNGLHKRGRKGELELLSDSMSRGPAHALGTHPLRVNTEWNLALALAFTLAPFSHADPP